MRICKPVTLILIVVSFYFISSCSSTSPREKMLIGTWRPHKIAPYVPNNPGPAAITGMSTPDSTKSGKQKTGTTKTATPDKGQQAQLQRLIDQQMRTTIKINANKTCEIKSRENTKSATWKLKKNGTNLVIKEDETGHKGTLEFVFINDTTAMAIQRTKAGDIIIRYRKQ
jgi:hypothetical protein